MERLEADRRDARTELFNACRRNLGLRHTLPIVATRNLGPSAEEQALHDMKRQLQERDIRSARTAGT
jgi:hypothetical protein